MKKVIYILLAAIVLISTSCNDWMDIDPQSTVVQDEFWSSKENVEQMVAASYNSLRSTVDESFIWGEIRADLFGPGTRITTDQSNLMEGFIYDNNSLISWSNFYTVINNSNLVLNNIDDVKSKDATFTDSIYNMLKSEAIFIRSLCFYKLACTFKDVPMPLDGYESDNQNLYIEQTSQKAVFQKIVQDLREAKELSVEYFQDESYFKGRATTHAINALLMNVYLSMEDATNAISVGEEIENSLLFGIMAPEYWFYNFFPGNSPESIFELQFDYPTQYNPYGAIASSIFDISYNGYYRRFIVSEKLIGLFSSEDVRGDLATYHLGTSSLYKYVGAFTDRVTLRDPDANWIYYRMSDVLLMLAEAHIMNGNFQSAVDYIDAIRLRRGLSNLIIDAQTETDKNLYYRILLDERAREFAGEGKRWYDLVRISSYENFLYEDILVSNVIENADAGIRPILENKLTNHNFWYLPIHERELRVNDKLVQNEFYLID